MTNKTEWIALSEPGAAGKALCFRYWDSDIDLETCNVDQAGSITRGRPVGLFNERDIFALATHLPKIKALIKAADLVCSFFACASNSDLVMLQDMFGDMPPVGELSKALSYFKD